VSLLRYSQPPISKSISPNENHDKLMIFDVKLTHLQIVSSEHGAVLHMVKNIDSTFAGFGEIYFSTIAQGQRKDWRRHNIATAQLAVPIGRVRFALFDDRGDSHSNGATWDVTLGRDHYFLLTIPPGVWFAIQNVGTSEALIANCSSMPHDPTSIDRRPLSTVDIPYDWRD
jgi:dTDP-4-dehydrorhamnose 3,5-epimerase